MAKQKDELLDHEYDGIHEFDNPVPAWWTWLWIGSIVFSIFYYLHYHVLGTGQGVIATYRAEMEVYEKQQAEEKAKLAALLNEDTLLAVMAKSDAVEAGKTKYGEVCAVCHAEQGEGKIGPNLTDDYWLHANGSLMSIHEIISEGVAAKGMPAWGKILTPDELNQVVAFVGTLRGKNLEGKEPQGKKIGSAEEPNEEESEAPTDEPAVEAQEGETADS